MLQEENSLFSDLFTICSSAQWWLPGKKNMESLHTSYTSPIHEQTIEELKN
jgi:hypothetical protein